MEYQKVTNQSIAPPHTGQRGWLITVEDSPLFGDDDAATSELRRRFLDSRCFASLTAIAR